MKQKSQAELEEDDLIFDDRVNRLFFRAIPTNAFYKDCAGKYQLASESCIQDNQILCGTDPLGKDELELYGDVRRYQEDLEIVRTSEGVRYMQKLDVNGEPLYIDIIKEPVLDDRGFVLGVAGIIHNITPIKLLEEKMRIQSMTDSLTGLYNRSYFQKRCQEIVTEDRLPLSILVGDSNNLKYMNDNFGHEIGDMLLVETAHNLKSVTGQEDELFRVGGDEFVLFLPRTDFEGMMEKLGTIRKLEKESRVTLIPADTSFGYAVIESMEDSIADKLSQAETVMYRDKTMRKQHE